MSLYWRRAWCALHPIYTRKTVPATHLTSRQEETQFGLQPFIRTNVYVGFRYQNVQHKSWRFRDATNEPPEKWSKEKLIWYFYKSTLEWRCAEFAKGNRIIDSSRLSTINKRITWGESPMDQTFMHLLLSEFIGTCMIIFGGRRTLWWRLEENKKYSWTGHIRHHNMGIDHCSLFIFGGV